MEPYSPTPSSTPWYESNIFWVPLSLGFGIALTVVAAMSHDIRWLLWLAWPCFGISVWCLARRTREVRVITVLGVFIVGCGILWLSHWLQPKQDTKATMITSIPKSIPDLPVILPKDLTRTNPSETDKPRKHLVTSKDIKPKSPATNSNLVGAQSAVPTTPPIQPPQVTNNAPGGFAVSGGTLINPQVNNFKSPEPNISVLPVCGSENGAYQCKITIRTDTDLTSDIAFSLAFSDSLDISTRKVTTSEGEVGVSSQFMTTVRNPHPNNIFQFNLWTTPVLHANEEIYVTVSSRKPIQLIAWKRGY